MTTWSELSDQLKRAVELAFPDFQGKEATRKITRKSINYTHRRSDSIFERVLIEKSKTSSPILVSFQFGANFFPECPIPSGAFGFDAPLTYLLSSELRRALDNYWWGGTWYVAETTPNSTIFEHFRIALKEIVRPKFDEWAHVLLEDRVATAMAAAAASQSDVNTLEAKLKAAALENPPSFRNYSTEKLTAQLLSRAKGVRTWYLV